MRLTTLIPALLFSAALVTSGLQPAEAPTVIEAPGTSISEYRQIEAPEPETMIFEATAYCYTGNQTATGTWPTVGRTVAADTRILPYRTKLVIDGVSGYVVEDCGNNWSDEMSHTGYYKHIRGNRIDLFVSDYETAIQFGRREVIVEIE